MLLLFFTPYGDTPPVVATSGRQQRRRQVAPDDALRQNDIALVLLLGGFDE